MSVSDLRGGVTPHTPGPGHGRTLSQDRSGDRHRAESRTRGLADIDPKFISQVCCEYYISNLPITQKILVHVLDVLVYITILLTVRAYARILRCVRGGISHTKTLVLYTTLYITIQLSI